MVTNLVCFNFAIAYETISITAIVALFRERIERVPMTQSEIFSVQCRRIIHYVNRFKTTNLTERFKI